eukprot:4003121-Pyramimonas_sp.AAC.1
MHVTCRPRRSRWKWSIRLMRNMTRRSQDELPLLFKKHRSEDFDLNDPPLQEGLYRIAVATGDWQPSIPA